MNIRSTIKKSLILGALLLILVLRKDGLMATQQNSNANKSQRQQHVPGRVLVKFRDQADKGRIDNLISQMGASIDGQIPGVGIHILHLGSEGAEEAVAKAFANRPEVEFAEPD